MKSAKFQGFFKNKLEAEILKIIQLIFRAENL